jgi:hypothetical protein
MKVTYNPKNYYTDETATTLAGGIGYVHIKRDDGRSIELELKKITMAYIHARINEHKGGELIDIHKLGRSDEQKTFKELVAYNNEVELMRSQYFKRRAIDLFAPDKKPSYWLFDGTYIYNIKSVNISWKQHEEVSKRYGTYEMYYSAKCYINKMFELGQQTMTKIHMLGDKEFTEKEIEALSQLPTTVEIK